MVPAVAQVPRPDGKPDLLGLNVLDEPAARQSDPSVLSLQLRQLLKRVRARPSWVQHSSASGVEP